jgi:hypothetical protein
MSISHIAQPLQPSVAYGMNDHPGATPSAQAPRSTPLPVRIASGAHAPRQLQPSAVQQRLVASAQAKAASPPLRTVTPPNRHAEANQIIDKYNQAMDAGVKLGERNFFKKLASVALNVAIVAIAVAATVATGGAAIAITGPLIALVSVNLATSMGDAACCYKNWQAAKDQANGGTRERLIGGDSCITHGCMSLCRAVQRKVGGNQDTADNVAKGLSAAFKIGLGAATAFYSGGLANAASLAKIGFYVTKGVGIAINLVTIAQRGIQERQFLKNVPRAGDAPDHYAVSIPRGGPRMQQMNSIANESLQLLMKDPNAFVAAAATGTPNPRRTAVAEQLQARFQADAERGPNDSPRPGQSYADYVAEFNPDHEEIDTDADNARDFARFTQGGTEDIGNAFISAGLNALAIGGLVAGELGWTALMVDALKDVL